jgi:two-component system response regulator WspF
MTRLHRNAFYCTEMPFIAQKRSIQPRTARNICFSVRTVHFRYYEGSERKIISPFIPRRTTWMRIAIVNDLALAREVLRRLVLSAPGYSVAWMAENGEEAVRKAAADQPDIILMDLIMPVMDGAEATRRIMANSPCPILLVTSTVAGNFNLVYKAMGYGGLDAVNTPTMGSNGTVKDGEGILLRIAKLAALEKAPHWLPSSGLASFSTQPSASVSKLAPVVAIGASTGGPDALARLLRALPRDFAAGIILVQHIAADFAPGLAQWLQVQSSLPIRLAKEGDEIKPGEVLLAGTNDHLIMRSDRRLAHTTDPVDYPYRPSVDVFFASLAKAWPRAGVAVLLTGMGNDGAQGLLQLRQQGWHTIAQDQASSVVYGMPRAAADLGAASKIVSLDEIASIIVSHMKRMT